MWEALVGPQDTLSDYVKRPICGMVLWLWGRGCVLSGRAGENRGLGWRGAAGGIIIVILAGRRAPGGHLKCVMLLCVMGGGGRGGVGVLWGVLCVLGRRRGEAGGINIILAGRRALGGRLGVCYAVMGSGWWGAWACCEGRAGKTTAAAAAWRGRRRGYAGRRAGLFNERFRSINNGWGICRTDFAVLYRLGE